MSDSDIERIKTLLEALSHKMIEAPNWRVVRVQSGQSVAWRRAPGAAQLLKKLGSDAFDMFRALISLGTNALKDSKRDDLTPSERIGRSSLELLISISPLAPLALGAALVCPEKADWLKSWLFSSRSPHVNFFADQIVRIGGRSFQVWKVKPNWLDFI